MRTGSPTWMMCSAEQISRATPAVTYIASGGFTGGGLRVAIGGINSQNVTNMSGGWQRSFTLGAPAPVTISFRYRLTENPTYEAEEFSQALVSVDGILHGIAPNDYLAQVVGGGPTTTGWQLVQINLGTLAAGTHMLRSAGITTRRRIPTRPSRFVIDDVSVIDRRPAANHHHSTRQRHSNGALGGELLGRRVRRRHHSATSGGETA